MRSLMSSTRQHYSPTNCHPPQPRESDLKGTLRKGLVNELADIRELPLPMNLVLALHLSPPR